jgi:aspartate aminotransferase-like enzyme
MLRLTEEWVETQRAAGIGIGFLARAGERAATVSCLTLPPDRTSAEVVGALKERGFLIGRGYGQLQDSTIRIGHMGDHTVQGLGRCLEALGAVLAQQ